MWVSDVILCVSNQFYGIHVCVLEVSYQDAVSLKHTEGKYAPKRVYFVLKKELQNLVWCAVLALHNLSVLHCLFWEGS